MDMPTSQRDAFASPSPLPFAHGKGSDGASFHPDRPEWIEETNQKSLISRNHILLLVAAILVIAALVIGAIAMRGNTSQRGNAVTRAQIGSASSVDTAPLADESPPAVEPNELLVVAPNDARAINARVPFSTDPNPAAKPFVFAGLPDDFLRATDCLAAAVLYEAGDDHVGQQAVAQVILNRARHPAYPSTVCGVVFQGSERRTGCQFTFTCDGALNRQWSEAAWARARNVANAALSGAVYAPVGLATHYHTDWVVPYWSSSLEKITAVGTHLFFRWPNGWGKPPAFKQKISGIEPSIAKMVKFSMAHSNSDTSAVLAEATVPGSENPLTAEVAAITVPATAKIGTDSATGRVSGVIMPSASVVTGEAIVVTLAKGSDPDSFEALARAKCGVKSYCKVLGWTDASKVASSSDVSDAERSAMSFSFLRNSNAGFEKALWNCKEFPRANKKQCMRG